MYTAQIAARLEEEFMQSYYNWLETKYSEDLEIALNIRVWE